MSELSDVTTALAWVAAVLLLVAGAGKLRAPDGTVAALRSARWPASPPAVRALGSAEVAVGAAVLLVGGVLPALAAATLYAGFAAFVVRQRRTAGGACGCFGAATTPVTGAHVAVDVGAAVGCAAAATVGGGPGAAVAAVTAASDVVAVGTGATTLVLVVVAAWLVRLLLTAGVDLAASEALHPPREGAA